MINHFGVNNHQICRINSNWTINYSAGSFVGDSDQIRRRVEIIVNFVKSFYVLDFDRQQLKLRPCVNTVQFPEQSPWWGSCRTVVKVRSLRRGPRDGRSRNLRRGPRDGRSRNLRRGPRDGRRRNLRRGPRDGRSRIRRSDYLMSRFCSWTSDVIMGQDLSCIWDADQAVS